ncbi:hypothetical protein BJ508DRAFT_377568 [Ascobolus immersus RN42]|uniref:Uncharacterized protein n=1 Tax=Ascobolus immersus RN42 TaxID=1160509 RepID=A0A3N4I0D9_ASCIM|nr:hypothetical protein BJ508DRAFT_377568 [Ascobolus immersus RN42]
MSLLPPLRRTLLNRCPACLRTSTLRPFTTTAPTLTGKPNAKFVPPKTSFSPDGLKKARKQWRQGPAPPLKKPEPFRRLSLPPAPSSSPDPRVHEFIKFLAANLGYSENPKQKALVVVGGELSADHPQIVQVAVKAACLYGVQTVVVGKDGVMSARKANLIKKDRSGQGCILIAKEISGKKKGKKMKTKLDEDGKPVPKVEVNMCYAHFDTPEELETKRPDYLKAVEAEMTDIEAAVHAMPDADLSRVGKRTYFEMTLDVVDGSPEAKVRPPRPVNPGGPRSWLGRGSKKGLKDKHGVAERVVRRLPTEVGWTGEQLQNVGELSLKEQLVKKSLGIGELSLKEQLAKKRAEFLSARASGQEGQNADEGNVRK